MGINGSQTNVSTWPTTLEGASKALDGCGCASGLSSLLNARQIPDRPIWCLAREIRMR